ncbi:MAG: Eco57I restriction-modification methylase domain-containing protein, partial [bacterium]
NFHLPEFEKVKDKFAIDLEFATNEKEFLEELWNELREAHKFGSLLTLDQRLERFMANKKNDDTLGLFDSFNNVESIETQVLNKLKDVFSQSLEKDYSSSFIRYQSLDAVKFAEIMLGVNRTNDNYEVIKYDIAVANPPYTDSANYGKELKNYASDKYKEPISFHKNLYACFLKKNSKLINEQGKIAIIHPLTFMYIKSYEDMREFILNNYHINTFVDFGLERNTFMGVMVDPAFYVLEKQQNGKSLFINVNQYTRTKKEKFKKKFVKTAIYDYINGIENKHNYTIDQEKLKIIDGYPFIYWISDSFREKFAEEPLGEILDVKQGLATSNNLRFLRFWWEVNEDKISQNYEEDKKKWVPYQKGGKYKKWYGNNWLLLNWDNNGHDIRSFDRSVLRNEDYYFKEGITYTLATAKGISMRYLPQNNIFDVGGSSIFLDENYKSIEYILGLMNSNIANYIISCLNPSVNSQVGDFVRVPFVDPTKEIENEVKTLSHENIKEKQQQYQFDIIEREFENNPMNYNWNFSSLNIEQRLKKYVDFKYNSDCKIFINEALIDELIFNVYELTDSDRKMVLEQEGLPVGLFPVLEKDKNNYLDGNKESLTSEVIQFINNLSSETKRSRNNLIDDIKDLYKKNKSLEEIAKALEINPISVVEIIKEFDFYPQNLAYQKANEFILDLLREILMQNDDGIVVVNEYAGEEPLDMMIENRLYDKGFSSGDIKRLESMLGKNIKSYLLTKFFSDECDTLNLFMYQPKTPFIWHLSSGENHGFDVYTIIYRWNRDKILKIKSYYIDKRRAGLNNRLSNIAGDDSASAVKEKDKLRKQLNEIKVFEDKLDQLLSSGYNPVLDDGVGKNIAPLQDLGLLADDVLTKGQLKKFLNADW